MLLRTVTSFGRVGIPGFALPSQASPGARTAQRRGASTVEFAAVAPLLFLLVLGMIEFGRMMMVQEILTNSAREGARKAVLPGSTDMVVYQAIDSSLANAGISGQSRQCSPSAATATAGTAVQVTVSVPYNNVSWLPVGNLGWLAGRNLTATVEMRKEEY